MTRASSRLRAAIRARVSRRQTKQASAVPKTRIADQMTDCCFKGGRSRNKSLAFLFGQHAFFSFSLSLAHSSTHALELPRIVAIEEGHHVLGPRFSFCCRGEQEKRSTVRL